MTGRKNLVAVDSDSVTAPDHLPNQEVAPMDQAVMDDFLPTQDEWAEEENRRGSWLAPALALGAVAAWTAFFVWANLAAMAAGAAPAQWAQWLVQWSVPVLLVAALWLIAMRSSTREASRFGDAAGVLSRESQLLEQRLSVINRELSLARDFMAAQSRDLESLGRVAAERLSQNADRLQELIRDNGAQVETIGQVSSTAVENMDRLRDHLPVISNSARDVANQIGRAGDTAGERLDDLIAGFERLNEFGEASGRAVETVRCKVDAAVAAFEGQARQMEEIAAARFADLAERSAGFRAELDGREIDAFVAIRRRSDTLAEELNQRADEFLLAQEGAIDDLRTRMAAFRAEEDEVVTSLRQRHAEMAASLSAGIAALEQRVAQAVANITQADGSAADSARERLAALEEQARLLDENVTARHAAFTSELEQRQADAAERERRDLAALEERIARFDEQVASRQAEQLAHVERIAGKGEALGLRLEAISADLERLASQGEQAGDGIARTAGDLGGKLEEGRLLLADSEERVSRLTEASLRLLDIIRSGAEQSGTALPEAIGRAEREMTAIEGRAQSLAALVGEANERGSLLAGHVEAATREGATTLETLGDIERRMAELSARSQALAGDARGQLDDAMAALELSSAAVLERMRDDHSGAVRDIAERIGRESGEAIDRALRQQAAAAIGELQQAAASAGDAGREAAIQLRDQLALVNELAGNLERRVAQARERAQEQVDSGFARRMALITESLNSTTIDISKAFDNEVTDTAWAAYLRGDRGIFTRRAVRLLNAQDQRAVVDIYNEDGDFRETVNRYINDFEAMLRSVLSTEEGNAIAVTLLSSDMGKLYVALAQALDRLRG